MPKSETPKTNASFTKQTSVKTPQLGTPAVRQAPTLKGTPRVSTPSVKNIPVVAKPASARTHQTGTPGAKKTPAIVKPVSAKTSQSQTGTKKTQPSAKPASANSTPVFGFPKGARNSPSSAGARNLSAKRLTDSGGAKRASKSTPVCIGLCVSCSSGCTN